MKGQQTTPMRILAIASVPLAMGASFAWAAGWLGPARLNGAAIVDALEYNGGHHAGYRRAHAKGLCFAGSFVANGAGEALSRAGALRRGEYRVIGRFSTGGGNPLATDGRNVFHAMALQITASDGQVWRMAMDHTPIFPVASPEAFVALQKASRPDPATGKPDPVLMKPYLAAHPETRAYQAWLLQAVLPDSFANGTYYSINAFRFTNASGRTRAVRWSFAPEVALHGLDKAHLADLPRDYLFNEMVARLGRGAVRWHMLVTVAAPGDPTSHATIPWPATRQTIDVGVLSITRALTEDAGDCRDITFDPTTLPSGIGLSDDPLLAARSAAYAASFRRRALERPGVSAVSAPTGKGG